MFFKSKETINIKEFADMFAQTIMNSISDDSLKRYSDAFKDMGENTTITQEQKNDLLIFNMLSSTRAIQNYFHDEKFEKKLLDLVHERVYELAFSSEKEQEQFEEILQKRYGIYYTILASGEENIALILGKQFMDFLLKRDVRSEGMVMIFSEAEIFITKIELTENLIKDVLSKFDLK